MQDEILSWFLQGGSISIPKRLFGLMDALSLDLNDIGAIAYLLNIENQIEEQDFLGYQAAMQLEAKKIIDWDAGNRIFSFQPLFAQINEMSNKDSTSRKNNEINCYSNLLKVIEQKDGHFLSEIDKKALMNVMQKYRWSIELIYETYHTYCQEHRRQYSNYEIFARMAAHAGVQTVNDFKNYHKNLNWDIHKVKEVLTQLGKFNAPTVAQKEYYIKWQKQWGFTHEVILMAADETINADNPSIGYLDKVLESWYKQGLKEASEILKFKKERSSQRIKMRTQRSIKNKSFENAEKRNFDWLEE